ncbi:MAG TPA: hypothetical protein V6C96_01450, partial [Vampirovibrionales bacterium]
MDLRELFKQMHPPEDEGEALEGRVIEEIHNVNSGPFHEEQILNKQTNLQDEYIPPETINEGEIFNKVNVHAPGSTNLTSILSSIQESAEEHNSSNVIPTKADDFFAPPSGMHDVGLSPIAIQDLLLKFLFYQSSATGKELANKIRLPLHSIVDPMLMQLVDEHYIDITSANGVGGFNRAYRLSKNGYNRAKDVLKSSSYVGPAPVSLRDYNKAVEEYYKPLELSEKDLKEAYKDLVISEEVLAQIGPALNSGKSMFMYGPPGTGKTSVAERITRCYKSTIKIPYAINVQGIPMRFFDYFLHKPANFEMQGGALPPLSNEHDNRWVEIQRPCIIVGPEFTIASADLQYDPEGSSYQFPNSAKANGGVFVVDDFGRQKENPEALLNRWIIPLGRNQDILNLRTGQQISIPFKVFMVFSTNLDPAELVDEAFLRRLAYKMKIDYPNLEVYCQIFANEADKANIKWEDELLDYLIQTHYMKAARPLRASDPRDLLARVVDYCKFNKMKTPFTLTKELID